ncbi:MAG: sulfatase [Pseudomonadota bacterium]
MRTPANPFMNVVVWLGCVLALSSLSSCSMGSVSAQNRDVPSLDTRPNVIVILVDDQRYDAFGALNASLKTPSLDRLLSEGVRYENAFVTTSLCSPSRASIMSGQAMRNHGIVDNNSPTPEGFQPFSVLLDEAGYDTAFIGKWHMGNADNSPKDGFDHWVSFEGQGNYGTTDAFGRPSVFNVNGETVQQTMYISDELTDYAVRWLQDRSSSPFLLFLSHKAVHLPFTPAERHSDLYRNTSFPLPQNARPDDRSGPRPMWLTTQNNSWHGSDFAFYSDRPLEEIQRSYYAALSGVDESTGRILDTVNVIDSQRDTVIIYTSDNGFMFGEHGLVDKRAAYEASMRVPFVIHAPNRFEGGTVSPVLARNIDIAPTILSLADVEIPDHYDGRDLLSVDPALDYEALIYEYYWEFNYPQTPSTFAIRTQNIKYIQYHGVWDTEELFDLESDPDEMNNLILDPAYQETLIEMRARLHEGLRTRGANPAVPFTERYNQGAVFWNPDVSTHVGFPEHWARSADAEDKYEHILPDSPAKNEQLKGITPILRSILDASEEEMTP